MVDPEKPTVAIVDYGMGNLFSVKHACLDAGLQGVVTASPQEVLAADAVILPGVGAFGDAMRTLQELGLVEALKEVALSSKPLVGICLGMQMLLTESCEFGRHAGLGLIPGRVVRFENPRGANGTLKVPEVCWNRMRRVGKAPDAAEINPLLQGLPNDVFMYFVHSFYCIPEDPSVATTLTRYGHIEFCSSLRRGNIFAFQSHPERSGPVGIKIYHNLAAMLSKGP